MKILVPCKRVSDPDNANKVKVSADGTSVNTEGLEWKPNPFDDWAVETALRLNENAATNEKLGEIAVATFGPAEAVQQLRQFLAMGADRGVLVEATDEQLDSWIIARGLEAVAKAEESELIVMGKQSADGESSAVGPMVAELLGWPCSTGVMSIDVESDGKLLIRREADGGVITQRITLPAVLTVTDRVVTPTAIQNGVTPADHKYPESDSGRYASLKGIMQAKKKPIDQKGLDALGIDTAMTSSYGEFATPPARTGNTDFVESVEELVQKLHTDAKVL